MAKSHDKTLYALASQSRCYGCDKRLNQDDIVKLVKSEDEKEVLCVNCAELENFEFLKKGNQKLTRLAKKYSKNHYVILKWSHLWKSYERQGLFLESEAIEKARQELLSS